MIDEIYKKIGLNKKNELEQLSCIKNILNLDDYGLFMLFTHHKMQYDKIICNTKEIVSLVEILLESKIKQKIVPLLTFYEHPRIIECYCNDFNSFNISTFLNSSFYKKILQEEVKIDSDFYYKFIINIVNKFCDQIECYKIIKILPECKITDIDINFYTFIPILNKTEIDVTKLMTYNFTNINEIDNVKKRLKNKIFLQNVTKYIKSQELVSTTILIYAILINHGSFCNLRVSNVDFELVKKLCQKKSIYNFCNLSFKSQFLQYLLKNRLTTSWLLILINKNSYIKYETLNEQKKHRKRKIYLVYFIKKCKIVENKSELVKDVKELMDNKLYDTSILIYLLINDIDFGLINTKEALELVFAQENDEVKQKCVDKYFNYLYTYKITFDTVKYNNLFIVKQWIQQNVNATSQNFEDSNTVKKPKIETINLPIVESFKYFTNEEINFLVLHYIKNHKVNDIIHFILFVTKIDNHICDFIVKNYKEITSNVYKLAFIDKTNLNIDNCEIILAKCNEKEKNEFVDLITNFDLFTPYFVRNDKNSLSTCKKFVTRYFHGIQQHLQLLNNISNVHHNFIKYFLYELYNSNYDTTSVCESVNTYLAKQENSATVLNQTINYYIKKVLTNEFLTEKDFMNTKTILEIVYIHTQSNKNIKLIKKCDLMLSLLQMNQQYFDVKILVANLKSLPKKK